MRDGWQGARAHTAANLTNLIAGTGSGTEWIQAWNDLGSGIQYGSFSVEASTEGTIRSATLSSSAISKISSSRGSSVGIGVSLESYSGQTLDTEWATFAVDTEARTHQLRIVVVP